MVALLLPVAALAVWLSTKIVYNYTLRKEMLDISNERSSHTLPAPRGGGAAFAAVILAGLLILALAGRIPPRFALALIPGAAAVALVGWLDDKHNLPLRPRLVTHILAALWALLCLGSPAPSPWTVPVAVFFLFVTVCLVNSYNFMDGIDGLAAGEAVVVGLAAALLLGDSAAAAPCLLAAAAVAGFLVWNWAPAKIFMGDAGSGFLGYVFALLWWTATAENPETFFTLPVLLGCFIVDSGMTLLWRMARGEKWYAGHRLHVFQTYAARYGHGKVAAAYLAATVLWLAPMAWLARRSGGHALFVGFAAYAPLMGFVAFVHATKTEFRREE